MDSIDHGPWRVLDANFNRCGEGLRVIEDWARFEWQQKDWSEGLKQLRHDLHELSRSWPLSQRLNARDSLGDIGRKLKTTDEFQRPSWLDVLQANFYRIQQSLRVLEEVCKLLQLDSSSDIEQLRYRSYDLQRIILLDVLKGQGLSPSPVQADVHAAAHSELDRLPSHEPHRDWRTGVNLAQLRRDRLKDARLYVLTDGRDSFAAFQRHITNLLDAGVDIIQLRDKRLSDRELYRRALWLSREVQGRSTLFIVNDRVDIAIATAADGVHVGQDELPVEVVRSMIGVDALIGLSTHNADQVSAAHQTSADYLGFGPIFPSKTKSFAEHLGLETLQSCAPLWELPTFIIGGIDSDNLARVVAAGGTRIAVQGMLSDESGIRDRVLALRKMLA
jgi:thiamine-phosphate pyrophosphorylase